MKIDSPVGICSSLPEKKREAVRWTQRTHLPLGKKGEVVGRSEAEE